MPAALLPTFIPALVVDAPEAVPVAVPEAGVRAVPEAGVVAVPEGAAEVEMLVAKALALA